MKGILNEAVEGEGGGRVEEQRLTGPNCFIYENHRKMLKCPDKNSFRIKKVFKSKNFKNRNF